MLEGIEMFQNSKLNAGFTNTSKINSLHKQTKMQLQGNYVHF